VSAHARKAARRRGPAWRVWGPVALVVAAVAVGVAIQAARSQSNKPQTAPAHALVQGGEALGRASAPVLVEEYGDFQCPICAAFEKTTGPTVRKLVAQGRIRFVYHPLAFIGPESLSAANAAECAGDQGRFWPFHDLLFARQAPENSGFLSTQRLLDLGRQAGVSDQRFQQCVRDGTYNGWLQQSNDQASRRGVTGTPTIFIDGREVDTARTPAGLVAAVDGAAGK
jgi:protein-disulfide isomerase